MASSAQRFLHVAGHENCGFFSRALNVIRSVSILFPQRIQVIPHHFADRDAFHAWLIDGGFRQAFGDPRAHGHVISPIVWFSKTKQEGDPDPADIESYLGSHDDALEWCRQFLSPGNNDNNSDRIAAKACHMIADGHSPDHTYDYDLVVIGGGSGGMAAAKEAAQHGARVACLDFVKPSPAGTTWGLGGTCVNVGCIPKKLYHAAALLHEAVKQDTPAFGVQLGEAAADASQPQSGELVFPKTAVQWNVLKDSIINYIRGLNFKYRVRLREKNVTYLNKLATFRDAHSIEAVDKKGKSSIVTSSRFLIAVGGRPTPLSCPGAELAISSDDIFFLEQSPGKTLCIGASYISLECAGFLAGLGLDVTVAVRSIVLRGFDRECSERVAQHMEEHGVRFRREVTIQKLEPVPSNGSSGKPQIKVTFSDGSSDVYDTVLTAVGRTADTAKLGLDKIGVQTNPNNGRILGKFEQTACPNVYAVGDVLDKTPELTPVAIQAGIRLARRLFAGSTEPMDYVNVCTTVFTPMEYACVGLSEDVAMEQYGADNIDVYHREFLPLEYSLSPARSHCNAFTKVIVDKKNNEKVLGIHYVGPHAGEVMQGYGVAMKQGVTFAELTGTVGIHPTNAEEIVTLSVTKRSGEDAAAGGC